MLLPITCTNLVPSTDGAARVQQVAGGGQTAAQTGVVQGAQVVMVYWR